MPSAFYRLSHTDVAKFLDPSLMGETATYIPAGGSIGTIITVNFGSSIQDDALGGGSQAQDAVPTVLAATTQVPQAQAGDTLIVDGSTFRVLQALPDGFGHTVLRLSSNTGFPAALPIIELALGNDYTGGLEVPLLWSLPADARRTGITVWRTNLDTNANPVLCATLGPNSTSYAVTVEAEGNWLLEVIAVSPGGPSAAVGLPVEVAI